MSYRLVWRSFLGLVALLFLCLVSAWRLHPPEHFGFVAPPRPVVNEAVSDDRFTWADRTQGTVYLPRSAAIELYLRKEVRDAGPLDRPAAQPAAPR